MSTHITWDEYKACASANLSLERPLIYRGQRDANWQLCSSLLRTALVNTPEELKTYVNYVLPKVHEAIESWSGKSWDLDSSSGLAEFLAYLQHNGFPTPLLDWTYSPYIAAYFAFESINHFSPQNIEVAIYSFDLNLWSTIYEQQYDVADFRPHVSVLRPRTVGNHKLSLQQGLFTWSNISDIEGHVTSCENTEMQFLKKYTLSVVERPKVIRELALMGISAVQLSPSIESVCKKALEDAIGLVPVESS